MEGILIVPARPRNTGTSITVTREPRCPGRISPFQYGQFIEYLCDLVPGMWAEKLHDGSFEGLSPYGFAFVQQTDFREKPWYPSGAVNRASYSLDPTDRISGAVSQKIAVDAGPPCTVGISQDGIFVEAGKAYTFACYLRREGPREPVRVRLHREGKELASCEFAPTDEWRKFRAQLVPTDSTTDATLSISFRGPAILWIENASLMPVDTVGGWRPDVVDAVRALNPGIIRFGGNVLDTTDPDSATRGDLDWRDTIGDPDYRKPFQAWGGLQPTGPGLEEIVQFIHTVGAEPLLCVPVRGRTPADAADEVEYFNGAPDSPMGKLRAANGHPEPYGVKYWQIGNERRGADYEAALPDFCHAMREVDPTIRILSSHPAPGVLRVAGHLLDYVSPHHYSCADIASAEADIIAIRALCREYAPDRAIRIAVTEWNTTAEACGTGRAQLWSLENALACARYHNLLHRHCDVVEIANRSNLTNSFCSGILQTDSCRLFKTPTYYAQQLYATLAGGQPLALEISAGADEIVDCSATLSSSGDALTLFAVNATLHAVESSLDFSTFGREGQEVTVWTLADREAAGEPDVANSFGAPQRVAPVGSRLRTSSPTFAYQFPALSLTVLRWRLDSP